MLDAFAAFCAEYGGLLVEGTGSTIVMMLVPTAISYVIGLVLGVVLYLTAPGRCARCGPLNAVLGWIVNIMRSFPFIVLMVFIIPFTRLVMGTGSGSSAPSRRSCSPHHPSSRAWSSSRSPRSRARASRPWRPGGASVPRIVFSALLPEALPSIVRGVAVVLISVLGYTAMAGAIGAGGLG